MIYIIIISLFLLKKINSLEHHIQRGGEDTKNIKMVESQGPTTEWNEDILK